MVTIYLNGKAIRSSRNLRCIIRYSALYAVRCVSTRRLDWGRIMVCVEWDNQAHSHATFLCNSVAEAWATRIASRYNAKLFIEPPITLEQAK